LYFDSVLTVCYFDTVLTVWYFDTVLTVWYFDTVLTVWYFVVFHYIKYCYLDKDDQLQKYMLYYHNA
jgi:hypothetical protein